MPKYNFIALDPIAKVEIQRVLCPSVHRPNYLESNQYPSYTSLASSPGLTKLFVTCSMEKR